MCAQAERADGRAVRGVVVYLAFAYRERNVGLPEMVAGNAAGRQQIQARAVRGDHADERYSGSTSGGRSRASGCFR